MTALQERQRSYVKDTPYAPLPTGVRMQIDTLNQAIMPIEPDDIAFRKDPDIKRELASKREKGQQYPEWWAQEVLAVHNSCLTQAGLKWLIETVMRYQLPVVASDDNCGFDAFQLSVYDHRYVLLEQKNTRRVEQCIHIRFNALPFQGSNETCLKNAFEACIKPLLAVEGYAEMLRFYGFDLLPDNSRRFEY